MKGFVIVSAILLGLTAASPDYDPYGRNTGYNDYGTEGNLRQIVTNTQQDVERELQTIIQRNPNSRSLEQEVRNTFNSRLDQALRSRYGNQAAKGGRYYSIVNGRLSTTSNYSTQDLENYRRAALESLSRKLQQLNPGSSGGRLYPNLPRPPPYNPDYDSRYPQQPSSGYNPQGSLPSSAVSASNRVQAELSRHLSSALEKARRYPIPLSALQNELRTNVTREFTTHVRRTFNLRGPEVDNLERQVEMNLMNKLNQEYRMGSHGSTNQQQDTSRLQRQLHDTLTRQLEEALMRVESQRGSYGSQPTQATLNMLTNEIERNVTREVQKVQQQNRGQNLESVKLQLKAELERVLQARLQQSQGGYRPNDYRPGANGSNYGTPNNNYRAPTSNYGVKTSNYGAPNSNYGAPNSNYGIPNSNYGVPNSNYGAPSSNYGVPNSNYGVPNSNYGVPNNNYGIPNSNYAAPNSNHGASNSNYGDQNHRPNPYPHY